MATDSPTSTPGETVLQARIKERLSALRRSARDVSLAAGLGPDAIRIILAGRSRSPRAETLTALARELSCDVSYLLGITPRPRAALIAEEQEDGTLAGAFPMHIEGPLSLEWQRFGGIGLGEHVYQKTNVFSVPDFDPVKQRLYVMEDDSMGKIIERGSYVHVLALSEEDAELKDKDIVVIERTRPMAHVGDKIDPSAYETQISLRRVRILFSGEYIYETAPSNPLLFDEVKIRPGSNGSLQTYDGREGLRLRGIALRATKVLSGPSVETHIIEVEHGPHFAD